MHHDSEIDPEAVQAGMREAVERLRKKLTETPEQQPEQSEPTKAREAGANG